MIRLLLPLALLLLLVPATAEVALGEDEAGRYAYWRDGAGNPRSTVIG